MSPADPLIGRVLDGRYRIEQKLGRGGMGTVYLAKHEVLGEQVAVKLLASEEANAARRFLREAKNTFRLDHANCVRVTDAGVTDDSLLYLVMEFLDGRSLGTEIEVDGALSPIRVAHVGAQIAAALGHAHSRGFIHRDLKPDNIMLVRRGDDADFTKVLDFGLSKLYDESVIGTQLSIEPLTREGIVFGTPEYMSPEQALGKPLGPGSDIYSLGVVLFHAVTGRLPFDHNLSMEILASHVRDQPPTPSSLLSTDGVNRLDALILSCMSKKPAQRPASARELAASLASIEYELKNRRPSSQAARPASRAIAASETLDLTNSAVDMDALSAASTRSPATSPQLSAALAQNFAAADASMTHSMRGAGDRRRGVIAIAVTLAALLCAAAIAAVVLGGSDPNAEPEVVASDTRDAATTVVEAADSGALPRTITDAAVQVADPPPRDAAPTKTAKERELERLVRAAKRAKRAGNSLGQLSNAQQAYKLDRRSSDARYLFGDALARSSDPDNKARGCKLLKRWKSRYKRAGCTD